MYESRLQILTGIGNLQGGGRNDVEQQRADFINRRSAAMQRIKLLDLNYETISRADDKSTRAATKIKTPHKQDFV